MGHAWVIISRIATAPTTFVLLPGEVIALAKRNEKDGRPSYWLEPTDYEAEQFRDAWVRIGESAVAAI
jgi:hypothetical protein